MKLILPMVVHHHNDEWAPNRREDSPAVPPIVGTFLLKHLISNKEEHNVTCCQVKCRKILQNTCQAYMSRGAKVSFWKCHHCSLMWIKRSCNGLKRTQMHLLSHSSIYSSQSMVYFLCLCYMYWAHVPSCKRVSKDGNNPIQHIMKPCIPWELGHRGNNER